MQTWAKRGVRAALVTGGVLAVGTTMAATEDANAARHSGDFPAGNGAHRASSADQHRPLHSAEDTQPIFPARDAAVRMDGELFPAHLRSGGDGRYRALVLTGRIDPVRDLLPAVEDAPTREIPALSEQGWLASRVPRMELAGWVADPATARPAPSAGRHSMEPGAAPSRHALRTPAEGFHRSLSWAGAIGEVVREQPRAAAPAGEGLVSLWQQSQRQETQPQEARRQEVHRQAPPTAALLDAESVDLTSGVLAAPEYRLHTLPPSLLAVALDEPAHAIGQRDSVSSQLPGEYLVAANEAPALQHPLVAEPRAAERPGVQAPLPPLGELNAFGADRVSAPAPERVGAAFDRAMRTGDLPTTPLLAARFTSDPLKLPVQVKPLDALDAVLAERDVVARNPFPMPRAAPVEMALPVLGGPLPSLVVPGRGSPSPGPAPGRSIEDTVELQRI